MPLYEYVCRECDAVFEARRSMADVDTALSCPSGHERVSRRLSVFATTGRSPATSDSPARSGGGGCCGGACGCAR